jgi:hypothetical protein
MSEFAASWALSRSRFLDEIAGLSKEQLNWRIHDRSLSIGEMAIHLAGVEILFASQLGDYDLDQDADRLKRAATEGVVNDLPFPFAEEEITPELVASALEVGRSHCEPTIMAATPESRQKEIKSALGPIITGEGAFTRLGFHSAYHQGQAYLVKTTPGFPPS